MSSCFLLPALGPSCFEPLSLLQPGKRHTVQHGLAASAETVIGKYSYKPLCKCWGPFTPYFGSLQKDPGALVSLRFLSSFGLCKSFSFYALFHPYSFFIGWLQERPSLLWTHWLCFPDSNPCARPCRHDIKKNHHFKTTFFFCPLMVLWVWIAVFNFDCEATLAVSQLTQSWIREDEWKPERCPSISKQKTIKFLCQKEGKTKDVGLAWKTLQTVIFPLPFFHSGTNSTFISVHL